MKIVIQVSLVPASLGKPEVYGGADAHLNALLGNAEILLDLCNPFAGQEPAANLNREWVHPHAWTVLPPGAKSKMLRCQSRTMAVPGRTGAPRASVTHPDASQARAKTCPTRLLRPRGSVSTTPNAQVALPPATRSIQGTCKLQRQFPAAWQDTGRADSANPPRVLE